MRPGAQWFMKAFAKFTDAQWRKIKMYTKVHIYQKVNRVGGGCQDGCTVADDGSRSLCLCPPSCQPGGMKATLGAEQYKYKYTQVQIEILIHLIHVHKWTSACIHLVNNLQKNATQRPNN